MMRHGVTWQSAMWKTRTPNREREAEKPFEVNAVLYSGCVQKSFLRWMRCFILAVFRESSVTSSLPQLFLCFKSVPMEQRRVPTVPHGPPLQPGGSTLSQHPHRRCSSDERRVQTRRLMPPENSWQIVAAGIHSQNSSVSPSILI